jgi:hypothetical protein
MTLRLPVPLRFFSALLGLAVAALPLRAAWAPPDAPQLARLDRALASWNGQYDPAERMIRRPFSSPGYHTTLQGGWVHPTRDSLAYAVGLLDTGRPADLARAIDVIRRVVALQDINPANKTYGIWSWFLEEPLEKMSPPDWNWADFNGVSLLQISRDHRARLPAEVAQSVDAAIVHACRSIQKRNVGPSYTNIAVMGTYVTLVAGEHLDLPEFRTNGQERLQRFSDYTADNGTFEEYNSPTYTVIALLELSRLQAHVRAPAARALIDPLVRKAWEELAHHFHAPTRQWAGPHSRAYSSLLSASTLQLIQRGTQGRVDFGVDDPGREDLRLPVTCPPDLEPLFRALPVPRTVTTTFIKRSATIGTTYLHPSYALGTINRGDLWNQRRPLLLHFGTAAAPGYLQLRFLKNGYDFSSAIFTGAQREGLVVGAVNLITNGGDTHISLDKVKNATIRARDLRLRFELGGPAAAGAHLTLASPTAATLELGALTASVDLLRARLGAHAAALTLGRDATRQWLDVVLHEGADREFNLATLAEAVVGFVFAVGPPTPATAQLTDGSLTLTCEGLRVAVPVQPGPRR